MSLRTESSTVPNTKLPLFPTPAAPEQEATPAPALSAATQERLGGNDGFEAAPAKAPVALAPVQTLTTHPTLKLGSQGAAVVDLQKRLNARGFNCGTADGVFGAKTDAAVRAFQRANGLTADGVVGPKTWAKLTAAPPPPPPSTHPTLKQGSSGAPVRELQTLLNKNGAHLTVDGQFGPGTAAAVRSYQASRGLTADGVVGPQTWQALLSNKPPVHPPPPPTGDTAKKILAIAAQEIGYHEGAGNKNKFSAYFGRPGEAWCADFVSYCATKAGVHLNNPMAQGIQNDLTKRGLWKGKHNPQPGDAVTFDWNHDGHDDHVGLVEKVWSSGGHTYIQTIEGNSSDQVKRNTYDITNRSVVGFGRIG